MAKRELQVLPTELVEQALEACRDGMVISDARQDDCPIIYANAAFCELTGFTADEVVGRNCRFLQREDQQQAEIHVLREQLAAQRAFVVTLRNYRKSGEPFWNELSISPVFDRAGHLTHFIGIQRDVSARIEMEQTLRDTQDQLRKRNRLLHRQARTDALTRLGNRLAFREHWQELILHQSEADDCLSLLQLDLDELKSLNDRFGHAAGDEALIRVADVLNTVFSRDVDVRVRQGGDEFSVLLPNCNLQTLQRKVMEFEQRLAAEPLSIKEGPPLTLRCSIGGVVIEPCVQVNAPSAPISVADDALYSVKYAGSGGHHLVMYRESDSRS